MGKLALVAAFTAMAGAIFAQSGEGAKEAFLRQQAYAEMQRVSGEVDVLRQNFSDLESKVRQASAMKEEIAGLKGEIAALKGTIAELRREMQAQRGEIVNDLSKKIVKIQQSQPAPAAPAPQFEYKGKTQEYTVVSGDTLSVIARALGTKISIIKGLNGLKSDNIKPGQKLVVPAIE
ncbi:MAG: LysM peptidoglycan-binding domain-containing protein [Kiritimatiellae bacterium]|nr:LysM peptidoglycan-binding domain-containing protein [Kiritimatiellia bacterium]